MMGPENAVSSGAALEQTGCFSDGGRGRELATRAMYQRSAEFVIPVISPCGDEGDGNYVNTASRAKSLEKQSEGFRRQRCKVCRMAGWEPG
jgi:hypothetical protein